jgi:hypothetical protein
MSTIIDGNGAVNGVPIVVASQAEAEAGTDNNKLMTPLRTSQGVSGALPKRAIFTHVIQSNGTGAQTFTGNTWVTRSLSTTIRNDITGAVLTSSQLSLPAGTYRFRVADYVMGTDNLFCTVRLFNVTDNAAIPNGTVYVRWGLQGWQSQTLLADIVTESTFATTTVIRIEHRNTITNTDTTPAFNSVIARLEVERLV